MSTTGEVSKTNNRSYAPLVFGLLFVVAGALLLMHNLGFWRLSWLRVISQLIPLLFLFFGLWRLVQYVSYTVEQAVQQVRRRGSLVFSSLLIFISLAGLIFSGHPGKALEFVGRYWPFVLIFIGTVKILDYYRLQGRFSFRVRELFGVIFIVLFGAAASRAADAHVKLLPLWELEEGISILDILDIRGPSFTFTDEKSHAWTGKKPVIIRNAYGVVRVTGGGQDSVQVSLKRQIYQDNEGEARNINDQIRLIFKETEQGLEVTTNREELKDRDYEFKTDLEVTAPDPFALEIYNNYGDIQVHGRKARTVARTSFASILVDDVAGDVEADNKKGSLRLHNIDGNVTVVNRNGEIQLEQIRGTTVAENSHGPIRATSLAGEARLKNSYDRTEVDGITKKLEVTASGGSVFIRGAGADVVVRGSHENLVLEDIRGKLQADLDYGNLRGSQLKGETRIQSNGSEIHLVAVDAPVTIQATRASVRLEKVASAVRVETSHKKVVVEEFDGSVQITNQYGNVEVWSRRPLQGPLTVNNAHGDIAIELPEEQGFKIQALASRGEIENDFEDIKGTPTTDSGSSLNGTYREGGPLVKLTTSYGNISVRPLGHDRRSKAPGESKRPPRRQRRL